MQKGDVRATWANTKLLKNLTGFSTNTNINVGIKKFIDWYKDFYQV
jgi:UDP-glucuronate 4-epimerase